MRPEPPAESFTKAIRTPITWSREPLKGFRVVVQLPRLKLIDEPRARDFPVTLDRDHRHAEHVGERHHLLDRSAEATYGAASLACPACGAMVIASQRFCPSCGTPTGAVGPLTEGRFRAGALFAGRFRIIALQGRGGMGQVYRAQDLELGSAIRTSR